MSAAANVLVVKQDTLWEHCRNNLGIARLLVHEGRPEPLVATACRMAVETGCRAALEQSGLAWDGDLEASLHRLRLKPEPLDSDGHGMARLAAAEKTVGHLAAYLRTVAPTRSWGF